jgi:O-antigen/teichoic acid export membrane protein
MNVLFKRFVRIPTFDKRTVKNIGSIIVLRGGNIGLQLLLVPVSIMFVSSSSYGLWLTLSSMITWLNIMDIGLSNGLRNKLSESIAKEDKRLGKVYVSTTYTLLSILSVIGFGICLLLIYTLNWNNVLEVPADLSAESFRELLIIISGSFFLTFLLKPIASVAYATHKAYIENLIFFISNLVNLIIILIITKVLPAGDLILLAYCFCFTPIAVTFVLSIILFRRNFADYRPSLKHIDFSTARELMSLSGKFFIIQIAATVVFTTNNFIISHYFGNEDVTKFNIVQRYFNVVIILQSMVLVPFWSLFSEGFARKNVVWLKENMNKLFKMTGLLVAGCVFMLFVSRFAYKLWLGDLVQIPFSLTLVVCIYSILLLISSVYTIFINGTGRVKLQMITSIFSSSLHIPLAIFCIKYLHVGLAGLILVSSFWLIITIPLRHIQFRKLMLFKTDSSIWTR